MTKKQSLRIIGEGSYGGGDFKSAKVIGDAKIIDRVQAEKLRVVGKVEFEGNVTADKARIVGEAEIEGNVKFGRARIVGKLEVDGSYTSEATRIYGEVEVEKDIICKKVKNMGQISTKGNLTSEEFISNGFCKVGGLLTAENMKLIINQEETYIKEIGGTNVEVKKKGLLSKDKHRLTSECIEADTVKLESTTVNVVRGNIVSIGKNCHIELVEYSEAFKQHESSKIGKVVKI